LKSVADEIIILNARPLRESDLIVNYLGQDTGRNGALVRGARRSKKRFAGALEIFSHLDASLLPGRGSPSYALEHAAIINVFPDLRLDLGRICMASYFCELCERLLPEAEPHPEVFELLRFFLERLAASPASNKQRHFFEVRLLHHLGLLPDWRRLRVCAPTAEAMHEAAVCPLENLGGVRFTPGMAREARPILLESIREHMGALPRSLAMLESEVTL